MDTKAVVRKLHSLGEHSLTNDELSRLYTASKPCPPLSDLASMSAGELSEKFSLSPLEAARIKGGVELARRAVMAWPEPSQVKNAADAAMLASQLDFRGDRECFGVMSLDSRHRCRSKEIITVGLLDSSLVHCREVFRSAVKNGAYAVIVAHNHPSGDPTPSGEDVKVTKEMQKAGEILNIRMLDHIILACGRYYSFAEKSELRLNRP